MAEIIELIETFEKRGEGTSEDPVRRVRQLWTKDGQLLVDWEWLKKEGES